MAEKYSFFNAEQDSSGNYDRVYDSADFANYFASFIGNGVYANPANSLQVSRSSGFIININTGSAWINGYYYQNTAKQTKTLSTPASGMKRIDRIVIRWSLGSRNILLTVIKGTEAVSPTTPSLTRTDAIYDICLATVTVSTSGVTNITDNRSDTSLCGYVSGVVDQIDTTDLFNQYDMEFNDWFNGTRTILDGDVAGNLQNEINGVKESVATLSSTVNDTIATNISNIWKTIYPIGSLYFSINNVNPSTIWGGTWVYAGWFIFSASNGSANPTNYNINNNGALFNNYNNIQIYADETHASRWAMRVASTGTSSSSATQRLYCWRRTA